MTKSQIRERNIDFEDVLHVLESPGQLLFCKKGRKIAQDKLKREGMEGLLRVIYEERGDQDCNNCILDIKNKKILEVIVRVRYDEQVDALYIRFKETTYQESDEIKEGIIMDYDKDGNVIGIEILDASKYLSPDDLSTVNFDVTRSIAHG